ncbi:hypothetical protein ACIQUQ_29555 [Streptomyces sp. NPDC101118]|uniref:hypothetical protein n=1 Tax=Streptomyces sp. NPDC101118 TaxID=3366109 RepID=UPI003823BDA1
MPHTARPRAYPTPYARLVLALSVLLSLLLPTAPAWAAPGEEAGDCEAVALGTYRGVFTETDKADCLVLPLPAGARLAVRQPYDRPAPRPETVVVDAAGTQLCDWRTLSSGTCLLTGAGPFRAQVTPGTDEGTGAYALALHRTDEQDCPAIPAGDFTSTSPAALFATGSGVFTHCFDIPADERPRVEQMQLRGLSGGLGAQFSVIRPDGTTACSAGGQQLPSATTCNLAAGVRHMVLVIGSDAAATYSLVRRDVTEAAKGCTATAPTAVGGPSKGGTLAAAGLYKCRQVTASDAADVLHINVRDPLGTANMFVFGADGTPLRCPRNASCAVSGFTRYQVLVYVPYWLKAAETYRFDAQRIATAAGPAAECRSVANVNYGYGPMTGSLDEEHTSVCLALPTSYNAHFDVPVSDTAGAAETGVPALYGPDLGYGCTLSTGTGGAEYRCSVDSPYSDKAVPSLFVLGLPEKAAKTSYRAELVCTSICGVEQLRLDSAAPATGITGTKVTVTVKGNSLHMDHQLRITRPDKEIVATNVYVSEDRRTLTAVLDLKGAATGSWGMRFASFSAGYFTVTSSPLENTTAPAITGTARVGAKLTASHGVWTPVPDSYTYQWKADGVAIDGATGSSLVVPASALGKKVTVTVRAHSAKYGSRSATSAATAAVGKGVAPKATTAPSVGGTAKVGRTLTAARGTWTPVPTSYRYQWYADGTAIDGATGTTLVLRSAQRGKRITVRVTALRTGHHSGTAVSAPTAVVAS